jgi:hypothetical protein
MRKIILATALAAALIPLTQTGASAAWPAPIGHRQPNAAEVPPNDSVIGESSEGRSAAGPFGGPTGAIPLDDGMSFPDICSNCDQ